MKQKLTKSKEPVEELYVVELSENIELMLSNKPSKRNKTDYNTWLKDINNLINKCNDTANYKLYGLIK